MSKNAALTTRTTQKKARQDPVELAIVALARTQPELGQARVAAELTKRGLTVSPSGVRHIWQRHDLETAYKRVKAIAEQGANAGRRAAPLTERQSRLLERGAASARRQKRQPALAGSEPVDRRMQILGAAADCFARDGYAASLRDIGKQIGLLPGSIYHHFPTKDDLFLAVHQQGFVQLIASVTVAIARGRNTWERLELACAEHIRCLVAGDTIARLTGASFFSSYEPKLSLRLKPDRDRYETLFRDIIATLDLPASIDRTMFRMTVLGAINWTHIWYREGRYGPEDIARHIVAIVRTQQSSRTPG